MSLYVSGTGSLNDQCTTSPQPLSVEEIENAITSVNATQIEGIAKSLIGHLMQHLGIDIKKSNIPKHLVYGAPSQENWPCYDRYSSDSKLMKILLPTCIKNITESFSTPVEFVQNGITFDFLNAEKTGLLDHVEDVSLKQQITAGMKENCSYSIALKVNGENTLKLRVEQHRDGTLFSSTTASIETYMVYAKDCIL